MKDSLICLVDAHLNVMTGKAKNHRELIKKFKLQDDRIRNRHFVRVHLFKSNGLFAFGFDDPDTVPDWFNDNRTLIEKKCIYYFNQQQDEIKQPIISDFA